MESLLNLLKHDIILYLMNLNITEEQKFNILKVYDKYMDKKQNTYMNLKHSEYEIKLKTLLKADYESFKRKIDIFINSKENAFEYLNFIKKNKYNFNINELSFNDKKLYYKIYNNLFDVYEESLMNHDSNYYVVCNNLHLLAIKLGYSNDLKDNQNDKQNTYKDNTDMPTELKKAIENTEK